MRFIIKSRNRYPHEESYRPLKPYSHAMMIDVFAVGGVSNRASAMAKGKGKKGSSPKGKSKSPRRSSQPQETSTRKAAVTAEELKELRQAVLKRDERLRDRDDAIRRLENLYSEEMKVAVAERETAASQSSFGDSILELKLNLAEGRASVGDGAIELLAQAHQDRSDAEHRAAKEVLARHEDAALMHTELLKLRQYLEREMRAGLEGFRSAYKAQAFAETGEEARRAILETHILQQYAAREHSWAEVWQRRYETLKTDSEHAHRELGMAHEQQRLQAARILRLRNQLGEIGELQVRPTSGCSPPERRFPP